MVRIVKVVQNNQERKQLSQSIVLASRKLIEAKEPNELVQDLAAFITLNLKSLYQNVNHSAEAWERRGYWLKADRYRLEWEWVNRMSNAMLEAFLGDDIQSMISVSEEILQKLKNIKLPKRSNADEPWIGARFKIIKKRGT